MLTTLNVQLCKRSQRCRIKRKAICRKTKSDLPESVKHVLPSHAQDIYKEAFNSAWDQYKDKDDRRDDASREETAHKVAWAAVKHEYAKGDDDKWHKKS
ncbi:Cation transport regulator [Escherichia coli]|nr:Cation transport regulator [Escherichia coli]